MSKILTLDVTSFKFADNETDLSFRALQNGVIISDTTLSPTIKIKQVDVGYLKSVSAKWVNNHIVISSGDLSDLPVGSYLLELWLNSSSGYDIYPDSGFVKLSINQNATSISGNLISSITLGEFQQQFSDLAKEVNNNFDDLHAQTNSNTSNIELKANKTDLESLRTVVNNQSETISAKANQTDLNNLQTAVNSQGIAISKKAEQADLIATDLTVKNLSDRKADISLVNNLFKNAVHGDTIVQNTSEPAPEYKDLNALKPNTIVNYAISEGKVLNVPTSFASTGSFTVATLSPVNDIKRQSIQILVDKYNRLFYRICWNGWWTTWAMTDKWNAQNKIFTSGTPGAPYNNLNTLPVPSTVTYGGVDVLNVPAGLSEYVVTTMSGSGNLSGAMQLLVDKNTGHTYVRVGWGPTSNVYFSSWNQLDKEPETPTPSEERYDSPSLSMFGNFGVVGDSFASGSLKVGEEWGGQTDNTTWGAMIARKWGTNMLHLASSGLSTRSWLAHYNGLTKLNSSAAQDIYYCVLGINDFWSLGLDYIGTINDVESGADTFFGNYGKIIKAIQTKAPKAKIILFSIADPSTVATSFNVAIKSLANHFGIPYVDQKTDGLFTSSYYLNNMVGGHPTAPMYAAMALAFERLIKKAVVDNFTYFKDYGL